MLKPLFIALYLLATTGVPQMTAQALFRCENGKVAFVSSAPLEIIKANSNELRGIIDLEKRTFAYTVPIPSFLGFNSPLQREHFNENYMESANIPNATFHGKIIETQPFEEGKQYTIRAKGKLNIHGKPQERIIKAKIKLNKDSMEVSSHFKVLVEEHDIIIPKIVTQKIAEEIQVSVNAVFYKD